MEKIIKDVGEVESRLMDHRPVLQGEIRFFLREFEEKRAFREARLLENLSKMTGEMNQQLLPHCTRSLPQKMSAALTRLEAARHMAQRIHKRELEAEQSTHLQLCEEGRRQEWEEFVKGQGQLKQEVEEEHSKAVGRLSTQYEEMKKDLSRAAASSQ